jgi:hypothetical protein
MPSQTQCKISQVKTKTTISAPSNVKAMTKHENHRKAKGSKELSITHK